MTAYDDERDSSERAQQPAEPASESGENMNETKPPGQQVPAELPILPLKGTVVFPLTVVPLAAGQARSLRLIDDAVNGDRLVGLVMHGALAVHQGAEELLHLRLDLLRFATPSLHWPLHGSSLHPVAPASHRTVRTVPGSPRRCSRHRAQFDRHRQHQVYSLPGSIANFFTRRLTHYPPRRDAFVGCNDRGDDPIPATWRAGRPARGQRPHRS